MKKPRAWRALVAWFSAAVMVLAAGPAAAAGYYTQSGRIYDPASNEVQLRGISHFGFNADILQPQYLWTMGWKEQIAQIKGLGFNAVRVPFVPDTLYVTTTVDKLSYVDAAKNPELIGKTPLQALDLWMAEANRQGLYVLLDFHSVSKIRQYPTWFVDNPADFGLLWNGQAYTVDHWLRDLRFVAQRYAHLPYFFAIDVYNEPNGKVRWSTGDPNMTDPKYFWKAAVEKASAAILSANPRLLIFVQGIVGNFDGIEDSSTPMNWGENFQPQAYQPLQVPYDKLVLSPHSYGPDVYVKSTFNSTAFPGNLAAGWDKLFGKFHPQHPVVMGEWGGRYGNGTGGAKDVTWQDAFVDYLVSKGIRSSFYWCYTPNSGDTGGILDDNLAVRQDKMTLLKRHWGATPVAAPAPAPAPATPTGAGSFTFAASSYAVAQDAGRVTLTVNRVGGSAGEASVSFLTADGSARARTDYTVRRGVLTWAAGESRPKKFSVLVSNAVPFSGTRNFSVSFTAVAGATLGATRTATVTITGSKAGTTSTSTSSSAPPQPYIQSFGPTSGPVGTVVTLHGSGFTGLTAAWAGAAHDAPFTVISDSQVRVTIPASATSGAIGLLNPAHAAFTPSAFTVIR